MSTTSSERSPFSGRLAPLTALRYRDFRLMWFGQLISIAGSQMRVVAVNWQIYQLAKLDGRIDPAVALGLIGLARVIAMLVSTPLSGLIADRTDRRRLIAITSLLALATSVVLAVATQVDYISIWLIYGMVIVAALAGSFEMPARQAMLPSLVPPEVLPNAMSLNIIAWQSATVIGPSLAGLLLAWRGAGMVYWIDAISFLAVVIAAFLIRADMTPTKALTRPTWKEALAGLRFVFDTRLIAATMLLDFFATFFGAANTLMPLLADKVLGVGVLELGWMYSASSVGAVLAATVLTSVRIRRQGAVLFASVALFGLCIVVFGLSPWLWLTLLALALSGAADTVSMVIRGTIRNLLTPNELRGRMAAVGMLFFAGGPQLGELEAGLMAAAIGVQPSIALGGLLCIAVTGWMAWRTPELRQLDEAKPVEQ